MDKRKNIAINFTAGYKQMTGITIYLMNIIRAFNTLEDKKKPFLTVIYTKDAPIADIQALKYPYCRFYLLNYEPQKLLLLRKAVNAVSRFLVKKNTVSVNRLQIAFPQDIDLIFPHFDFGPAQYVKEKIFWKADFQEKYYPDFFPAEDLNWSNRFMSEISAEKNVLILSSYDAWNDYKKFYPGYRNEVKLLRFASILPDFQAVTIESVLSKFNISKRYFLIANQFWLHKNHIVVLKAIQEIKDKLDCIFLFTGHTTTYRKSDYYPNLLDFINEHRLSDFVKFLGFIDRKEQLQLMNHAIAIIQPSLFEGWSTVIEDSKALNKFVIASDLAVNKEQIETNAYFFNPHDPHELGTAILKMQEGSMNTVKTDYKESYKRFQDDITDIFINN